MCAHAYAYINRWWQQAADLQHAADVVHLVRRELVFPSGFRPLHMRCNIFLQAPGPAVECAHACIVHLVHPRLEARTPRVHGAMMMMVAMMMIVVMLMMMMMMVVTVMMMTMMMTVMMV